MTERLTDEDAQELRRRANVSGFVTLAAHELLALLDERERLREAISLAREKLDGVSPCDVCGTHIPPNTLMSADEILRYALSTNGSEHE